jgi:alkylation response protein AidB-like acyl-CoA dehydrogenase
MSFSLRMKPEHQAIIEKCRDLAERFKPRAAQYDETAVFQTDNFEDIKAAGLLGIMVPREYGGLGADFLCYTMAVEQLARGDASTALNFTQHNITIGSLAAFDLTGLAGTPMEYVADQRKKMLEQVARKQELVAAATTELGTGFRPSHAQTRYRRTQAGYVLNGMKSFVSMTGYVDHYLVAAASEDATSDAPRVSYFVVDAKTPGLSVKGKWDTCGMRATVSNHLVLRDCHVPAERLFAGVAGTAIQHLVKLPHWAVGGFNGVYLGICDSIMEFAVDYLNGRTKAGEGKPLSHNSIIQHEVGKLSVALEGARAVVYAAADLVSARPGSPEANAAIYRAKYLIGETAPQMASDAMRICGGNSIRKEFPLERHYRDSRCGGLMGAPSDVCLNYIGKAALGIDVATVRDTHW